VFALRFTKMQSKFELKPPRVQVFVYEICRVLEKRAPITPGISQFLKSIQFVLGGSNKRHKVDLCENGGAGQG
jgi:hypothetical protein